MFERFTHDARTAVEQARVEAGALGAQRIDAGHVVLGAVSEPDAVATLALARLGASADDVRDILRARPDGPLDADALAAIGIDLDAVRTQVEATFGPGSLDGAPGSRPRGFDPSAKKLLEVALREAVRLRDRRIDTGHLLLAAARVGEGPAQDVLTGLGLSPQDVRDAVAEVHATRPAA
ncbi:Clp protease N-terminal domain-containing protein [Cellulomonas composti]|uniref:ATPase n=1 Tax=Cellulomonas composti TaxID=266130 RepID=A0A511J964_9CELL|nr:Clp protease N-terminal domain-containing protein [Cellulomonas composti]GEL94534.1 ATPase [Cellulomonas composti]